MANPGDPIGSFGNWLTPRLATGGTINNDPANGQLLKNAGITAVIDCAIELDDTNALAQTGIAYLNNGTADDGQTKPPAWFETSLNFALPLLAQPHQRVYAHCAAGANRGPSTAYCVLRAMGISPTDAMTIVKTHRPQAVVAYAADADAAIIALGYD